jgi:thiol-disulfide isomerase/thioredoxin
LVVELTSDNFDKIVGKDKYVIVKFFTKWCMYCRLMAPEYEKLFELYQKSPRKDIVIARLEAGANEDIARRYNIFHFPMVMMFAPKSQEIVSVFKGKRIASDFSAWIEQLAPPHLEQKPEEDEEDYFLIGDDEFLDSFNRTEFHHEIEGVKKEIHGLHEKISKLEEEIKTLKSFPVENTITSDNKTVDNEINAVNSNVNSEKAETANNVTTDNNSKEKTIKEDVKFMVFHNLRMPTVFEMLVGVGGMLTLVAIIMTFRKLMTDKKSYFDKTNHHAKV